MMKKLVLKNLFSLLIVIILSLFSGCCSSNNIEKEMIKVNRYRKKRTINTYLKVVDIKEYQGVYRLIVFDNKSKDTMIIVSLKDEFYDIHNFNKPEGKDTKQIIVGNNYKFKLLPIRTRVGVFAVSGYIIVEKDTIWKEKFYENTPKSYVAQNTIGLSIYENVDSISTPGYPTYISIK